MKIYEPAMKFNGDEGRAAWSKWMDANPPEDGYGHAVLRFASEWATRMEAELETAGVTVASCARQCAHDADNEGITGFMYGVAVKVLSDCWLHGEELRRWHNLDIQIADEGERANASGGVLNPALLTLGGLPGEE